MYGCVYRCMKRKIWYWFWYCIITYIFIVYYYSPSEYPKLFAKARDWNFPLVWDTLSDLRSCYNGWSKSGSSAKLDSGFTWGSAQKEHCNGEKIMNKKMSTLAIEYVFTWHLMESWNMWIRCGSASGDGLLLRVRMRPNHGLPGVLGMLLLHVNPIAVYLSLSLSKCILSCRRQILQWSYLRMLPHPQGMLKGNHAGWQGASEKRRDLSTSSIRKPLQDSEVEHLLPSVSAKLLGGWWGKVGQILRDTWG